MRNGSKHFDQFTKSAIGGLLIALILMLDAMAACPALHKLIHKNAGKPDHHCAVTMLAQGKVSSVACTVVIPPPALVVEATKSFIISVFSPAIEHLPPGRAPPAPAVVS